MPQRPAAASQGGFPCCNVGKLCCNGTRRAPAVPDILPKKLTVLQRKLTLRHIRRHCRNASLYAVMYQCNAADCLNIAARKFEHAAKYGSVP